MTKQKLYFLIPIVAFVLLGVLLFRGLSLDPRKIPSPLVGKSLPTFNLPILGQAGQIATPETLKGQVFLLNVWASWCVACRQEHPLLMEMARAKEVPIIGLNYKDKGPDAQSFLASMGDPYDFSVADLDGRVGIELGVYGVPETFVVDGNGTIRYKHIGPIDPPALRERIMPVVKQWRGVTTPVGTPASQGS